MCALIITSIIMRPYFVLLYYASDAADKRPSTRSFSFTTLISALDRIPVCVCVRARTNKHSACQQRCLSMGQRGTEKTHTHIRSKSAGQMLPRLVSGGRCRRMLTCSEQRVVDLARARLLDILRDSKCQVSSTTMTTNCIGRHLQALSVRSRE